MVGFLFISQLDDPGKFLSLRMKIVHIDLVLYGGIIYGEASISIPN
jgi:hypothetical protein